MTARTFTMSKSLSEVLATVQPPSSETDFSLTQTAPQKQAHPPNHKPGITYAGQDKLPKLPIPELESTCRKYLDALKPLQTIHEQEETEGAVQQFLKSEGPELQARLKKYASGQTSYIEQFCTFLRLHRYH
jgi:carnitine O-acetyltransferase